MLRRISSIASQSLSFTGSSNKIARKSRITLAPSIVAAYGFMFIFIDGSFAAET
ncbi:hypothetical protein CLOLEP_03594 [[Clostridium] leptum DSM 753]|uniref:Uncharacterized protein n=1 Tax=[Clostridium] leptum DSM 753 TaxID=428125 RepID=A7VYB5_9FIRM|nr:hypothetical protein CLOLEP_03594 [[Clostridium] leptum DSM 753]